MNTWTRPNIPVSAVSNRTSTRREGFRASVVKPASRSAAIVDASSSRFGFSSRSTDMRRTNSADTAISAAVMVKTVPMLAAARRAPATAGPAKIAMLSMPLATAFAAVSSSGVRASVGVSAACDDLNGVVAIVAAIENV
jgi:hypothetical protein